MKSYWVNAIVMRSRPLGEADRVIWLLSDSEGKIRAAAGGARRGRSALAAGTQLFVYGSYQLFRGRELDSISQVQLIRPHLGVHHQLLSLALASYAAELVDLTTMERQPALGVFQLLLTFLDELDRNPVDRPAPALPLRSWFELHLLDELGFRPELAECVGCHRPATVTHLERTGWWMNPSQGGLLCSDCRRRLLPAGGGQAMVQLAGLTVPFLQRWQAAEVPETGVAIDPSHPQLDRLVAALRMYVDYYVNHTIRSLPFLEELMGSGRMGQGGTLG